MIRFVHQGGGGGCLDRLPFSVLIRRANALGVSVSVALEEPFRVCCNFGGSRVEHGGK
jgi:hypothetical protein